MKPDKQYVVILLFNEQHDRVLLIRKNRPQWQAGKLNGLGGKVEPSETPHHAATRELKEEAMIIVTDLIECASFRMPDDAVGRTEWCRITVFTAVVPLELLYYAINNPPTDEALILCQVTYPAAMNNQLREATVQTVPLIIDLALHALPEPK